MNFENNSIEHEGLAAQTHYGSAALYSITYTYAERRMDTFKVGGGAKVPVQLEIERHGF